MTRDQEHFRTGTFASPNILDTFDHSLHGKEISAAQAVVEQGSAKGIGDVTDGYRNPADRISGVSARRRIRSVRFDFLQLRHLHRKVKSASWRICWSGGANMAFIVDAVFARILLAVVSAGAPFISSRPADEVKTPEGSGARAFRWPLGHEAAHDIGIADKKDICHGPSETTAYHFRSRSIYNLLENSSNFPH